MNEERVASPCNGVCRMDAASGLCLGCRRTLDEIVAWSALDDEARHAIRRQLERRRIDAATQPQERA